MESQTFDEIPRMHFPALFSNLGQIGICSPQTLYLCITKTEQVVSHLILVADVISAILH